MSTFIVRPTNTDKDAFRVRLTAVSMLSLKLKAGDICELRTLDEPDTDRKKLAIAWEASGAGMKDTIVQTSKLLQEVYGFKLGDKVTITRSSRPLRDATRIVLQCLGGPLDDEDAEFYAKYARVALPGADGYLVLDQKIQFKLGTEVNEFVVKDIGVADAMIVRVTRNTQFRIGNGEDSLPAVNIDFQPTNLGGLDEQVRKVQGIVNRLCTPDEKQLWPSYRPVQGILLYGPKGTGKTAFITALSESGWPMVTQWEPKTEVRPSTEPQLIIVQSSYLSRNSAGASSLAHGLDSLFEQIKGSPILVVGETCHPNDIQQSLRGRGKFGVEIELPIPSAEQRKEILLALRGEGRLPNHDVLADMAERTHGYVGGDLEDLFGRTVEFAVDRSRLAVTHDIAVVNGDTADDITASTNGKGTSIMTAEESSTSNIILDDLNKALQEIRPSALQEIFLETPNVHWSDIGGQHSIKRQLHNAVERPLKHADRMAQLGLRPKKGVLLYGPPGCSKTLLVRALATEAGTNFLAVKGAELISMYVGESERATREVFRKARAASPSIIFFDEIDAIASRGRTGSDLNVLTTLLNEMDGFEELRNVFVVGATNKPQNVDPALMRPGRFDNVVYIGPPDFEARREIFQKHLGELRYQHDVSLTEDIEEFSRATEGFSGAEIVAICQTAGECAFDADRDVIVADDIRKAIQSTPKSITRDMLDDYESWNAARMR
ncbi:AAA+-type ATPase [Exophiala xenobiotica]